MLLFVYHVCLIMLINILKRLLKLLSTIFCQFFFSLNDSLSKIIENVFLFNRKSSFCSWDIQILMIFSRVACNFCNENSTIQEHFKNISILFKNISDIENIITIGLKGFFKRFNLIKAKDKSHQIQIPTRTKFRKA